MRFKWSYRLALALCGLTWALSARGQSLADTTTSTWTTFTGTAWQPVKLVVPDSELLPDGLHRYRATLDVPPPWRDQELAMAWGRVAGRLELWCDGELVGQRGQDVLAPVTWVVNLPQSSLPRRQVELRVHAQQPLAFLQKPFGVRPPADRYRWGPAAAVRESVSSWRRTDLFRPINVGFFVKLVLLVTVALAFAIVFLARRKEQVYGWFVVWASSEALGTNLDLFRYELGWVGLTRVMMPLFVLQLAGSHLAEERVVSHLTHTTTSWPARAIFRVQLAMLVFVPLHIIFGLQPVLTTLTIGLLMVARLVLTAYVLTRLTQASLRMDRVAWPLALGVLAASVCAIYGMVSSATGQSSGAVQTVGQVALVIGMTTSLMLLFVHNQSILERTLVASRRFVPQDFLRLIGRDEVTNVERGDSAAVEATILFADLRGFTALCSSRGPEEVFALLNRYHAAIEPCVRENGGFIHQYLGDGFVAVFPEMVDDAVQACLRVRGALDNLRGEHLDLQLGMGLHRGRVVVGTVGGTQQLTAGIVGDTVNVAARVEAMTKELGEPLLMTEAVAAAVAMKTKHATQVKLRGRSEVTNLFVLAQ